MSEGGKMAKATLVLLVLLTCLVALLPFASELVGAYWPELGRRIGCALALAMDNPLSGACPPPDAD